MTDTRNEHAGLAAVRNDTGMSHTLLGTQNSRKAYDAVT